jgi:Ca-activated chloride channel family protein
LVGYENRILNREDFEDDTKDAGEIGAGHTVTALYEIVPTKDKPKTDSLNYVKTSLKAQALASEELLSVDVRYKPPHQKQSQLISKTVRDSKTPIDQGSMNFRFASAVAEFGLLLKNSQYKAQASYTNVSKRARAAQGEDPYQYRAEFIQLVEAAEMIQ